MMNIRLFTTILALIVYHSSFSQGFKVKSFEQNLNDGSAFHAPIDSNRHPCGLIKVRTDFPDLTFDGNVVGTVENKMNEYWVFLANGSTSITIRHPNFIPQTISMVDYGLDKVSSKATYILTLQESKYKKEKLELSLVVKPENANLYIDDVFINNINSDGLYQLYLPKGEHICRIEQEGYRKNIQVVTTGKEAQHLNVELESVMAELEVKCKTTTSEIYIDGRLMGNGEWKGMLLAGEHLLEAKQANYEPVKQYVKLEEKESRTFVMPALKRAMGQLHVETIPSGVPVVVDGKECGLSPFTIDVETGTHYINCEAYGCIPQRTEATIDGKEIVNKTLTLQYRHDSEEDFSKAYAGDLDAILDLMFYSYDKGDYKQSFFWKERHPQKDNIVSVWREYRDLPKNANTVFFRLGDEDWIKLYCIWGDIDKALELYSKISFDSNDYGRNCALTYLGDAFIRKGDYDKAFHFYSIIEEWASKLPKSYVNDYGEFDQHYIGLGDYYKAKGVPQKAAAYYRKFLNSNEWDEEKRKEANRKLKELGL